MMFAGIYYSTQRLCKTRMASATCCQDPLLGLAAHHRLRGDHAASRYDPGKEYAELDLADRHHGRLIWVVFAINFFWTLAIRNEKNLYVALWFYIATIVTIAMLYIVNNLSLPVRG
jgi:cytochrome c oxidase cbb3-type subunit I/II